MLREEQTQITVEGSESYVSDLAGLSEEDRKNVETKLNDLFKDRTSDWIKAFRLPIMITPKTQNLIGGKMIIMKDHL